MRARSIRLMLLPLLLVACGDGADDAQDEERIGEVVDTAGMVADAPGQRGTDIDRDIFRQTMELAARERYDTLPIGELVARIGESFIGTPYVPGTLEQEGGERLVVNLRQMDCVTFVENALALARIIRDAGPEQATFDAFMNELLRIRYRDGALEGYPSRLHYFTEWIANNEELGLVRNLTQQLGGVPTSEQINFMSTHADQYPALADTSNLRAIREIERELSRRTRYQIPEGRIGQAMNGIEEGDIIAATSSIEGLDVAHTGIAVRRDGAIHLMHAPLVGDSVNVSELPLDERVDRIEGQDGIMVARPL